MEKFALFYEQIIFYAWGVAALIAVLLTIGRMVQLFFHYINTGKIGKFHEDCFIYNTFESDFISYATALYRGIHPGAIFTDLISYAFITFIVGLIWLPIVIFLPFVGLAYLLRKRIANKQEFMSRLEGTHNNLEDGEGVATLQSSAAWRTV